MLRGSKGDPMTAPAGRYIAAFTAARWKGSHMADNQSSGMMDRLVKKAWESESFKKELLANPRAAIEKEFGVKIPDNVDVTALEDTPQKIHVVVPMSPVAASTKKMSEADLEAVAGGVSWGCCVNSVKVTNGPPYC